MEQKKIRRAVVEQINDKTIIRLNSSAMGLLRHCERKADWILNKGQPDLSSPAADYGSLIHKALAEYYQLNPNDRFPETLVDIWNKVSETFEFKDPNKTKEIGQKVLFNYAKTYTGEAWRVVSLPEIGPAVEVPFEFKFGLINDEILKKQAEVYLFGTVDMIVQNVDTGEYAVMDHKTTKTIGTEFSSRWKPNHQMSAYIYAMNSYFKLPTNKAIINGLQIAKTVQNTIRIETTRNQSELTEFKQQVYHSASRLWEMSINPDGFRSFADSTSCSMYGSCKMLNVCSLPPELRAGPLSLALSKKEIENDIT